MVNFDCETMIYNLNHGEADSKDIIFYTEWYENSLKNGSLMLRGFFLNYETITKLKI